MRRSFHLVKEQVILLQHRRVMKHVSWKEKRRIEVKTVEVVSI